jgi:hypothetical protein
MADERYAAAYEAAMEEVAEKAADLAAAQRFANAMALKAGKDQPFADIETPNAKSANTIKSDQFANYTYPSEAARAFLAFRGQAKGAAELDAIFEALQAGGFAWGSSKNDPKGGLRIALGKDSQVRRLPNGTYGLWEWYPNAKKPVEKKKSGGNSSAIDVDVGDDAETPGEAAQS